MKNTKLTRNFPLKIMSVLIGFLIWFIEVNVDNPVSTKSITIAGRQGGVTEYGLCGQCEYDVHAG